MATLGQILVRRWKADEWRGLENDDVYSTLIWEDRNVDPKPSEAEIRAFSAAVDVELAAEQKAMRQSEAFITDSIDAILKGFEIVIEGMVELRRVTEDIRTKLRASAVTSTPTTFDAATIAKVVAMRDKIAVIRNMQ